jgi:uncharacterized membrane-anchored protein
MIGNKYNILRTGEEFKFRVSPVDPYDAFRGRYVTLYSRQEISGKGKYGTITVDEDGFAIVSSISDKKPTASSYVKSNDSPWFSIPIERYYMDEKLAPIAEIRTRERKPGEEAYVTVRIKNGGLVVSGLYIDGVAIEDIIREGL